MKDYTPEMEKFVENLPVDTTGIVRARRVKSNKPGFEKIQLEFAEKTSRKRRVNVLAIANRSDTESFNNTPGAQRAWLTGIKEDLEQMFGVTFDMENELANIDDEVFMGITAPEVDGAKIKIRLVENTTPRAGSLQESDPLNYCKKNPRTGDVFVEVGTNKLVFQNNTLEAVYPGQKLQDDLLPDSKQTQVKADVAVLPSATEKTDDGAEVDTENEPTKMLQDE